MPSNRPKPAPPRSQPQTNTGFAILPSDPDKSAITGYDSEAAALEHAGSNRDLSTVVPIEEIGDRQGVPWQEAVTLINQAGKIILEDPKMASSSGNQRMVILKAWVQETFGFSGFIHEVVRSTRRQQKT